MLNGEADSSESCSLLELSHSNNTIKTIAQMQIIKMTKKYTIMRNIMNV